MIKKHYTEVCVSFIMVENRRDILASSTDSFDGETNEWIGGDMSW